MEKSHPRSASDDAYTPDELIALIKAIKFAHPEMSIKNVHKEISGTMANSADSYAFLKDVKLDEVKKVWKKALKAPCEDNNVKKCTKKMADDDQPSIPTDGIMKFYTVGDGSVKTLAENYSKHHAQAMIAAVQQEKSEELSQYTHFFLDVPANMSGNRPHQALINFNDNNPKKNKSKSLEKISDGRYIYKIQVAQSLPGVKEETPMLLYNHCRTAKTFIHPPSLENKEGDGGYTKIKQMITESGTTGALGNKGGQKAYFWGRITETETGPNVVSIDITELAPSQDW